MWTNLAPIIFWLGFAPQLLRSQSWSFYFGIEIRTEEIFNMEILMISFIAQLWTVGDISGINCKEILGLLGIFQVFIDKKS